MNLRQRKACEWNETDVKFLETEVRLLSYTSTLLQLHVCVVLVWKYLPLRVSLFTKKQGLYICKVSTYVFMYLNIVFVSSLNFQNTSHTHEHTLLRGFFCMSAPIWVKVCKLSNENFQSKCKYLKKKFNKKLTISSSLLIQF